MLILQRLIYDSESDQLSYNLSRKASAGVNQCLFPTHEMAKPFVRERRGSLWGRAPTRGSWGCSGFVSPRALLPGGLLKMLLFQTQKANKFYMQKETKTAWRQKWVTWVRQSSGARTPRAWHRLQQVAFNRKHRAWDRRGCAQGWESRGVALLHPPVPHQPRPALKDPLLLLETRRDPQGRSRSSRMRSTGAHSRTWARAPGQLVCVPVCSARGRAGSVSAGGGGQSRATSSLPRQSRQHQCQS